MELSEEFDKVASVKRLTQIGATEQKDYQTHIATLPCLVQPLEPSISFDMEGSYGKSFLMMCDTADIVETDRIFIDGEEYKIMALESLEFEGDAHMELSIRAFKST